MARPGPELQGFVDDHAKTRLSLSHHSDLKLSSFVMTDETLQERIRLNVSGEYGASVNLYDSDGHHRAVLGRTGTQVISTGEQRRSPESSLHLYDREGKVLFQAP